MRLRLHTYFRSSASYRVRIAMNLKGIEAVHAFVHLGRNGGEQFAEAFTAINPQALVPVLEIGDRALSQSLAIIEYLDELHPDPPLLPSDTWARARARQVALAIACEIHPLNNLRVLRHLVDGLGLGEQTKNEWARHWMAAGLVAVESLLSKEGEDSRFCVGMHPTIADCCLVPQLFNARRFDLDLQPYPRMLEIERQCLSLEAFRRATPAEQADAS